MGLKCAPHWPWLLVLVAVLSTLWVRVNVSVSVPRGIYRLVAVPSVLDRGMLVIFPTPPTLRAWHTLPLLKPVVAVAGDVLCADTKGLWTHNGQRWLGPVLREAAGLPLPFWQGCVSVLPGYLGVASAVPGSIDSRYFGLLPISALTAQALPLWIWD
jgi:type IV secretory pathway protease TraF